MLNISDVLNSPMQKYQSLPEGIKYSFLPYFLASLPMLVFTLTGLKFLMPLTSALTALTLYYINRETESVFFCMDKQVFILKVAIPFFLMIPLWGFLLIYLSEKSMALSILGAYAAVLTCCIMPGFRLFNRTRRFIKFEIAFLPVTAILVLSSFSIVRT